MGVNNLPIFRQVNWNTPEVAIGFAVGVGVSLVATNLHPKMSIHGLNIGALAGCIVFSLLRNDGPRFDRRSFTFFCDSLIINTIIAVFMRLGGINVPSSLPT